MDIPSTAPRLPRGLFANGLLALMVSAVCVAFYPQTAVVREGALKPLRDAGLYLFKDQETIQVIVYIGLGIHVVECVFTAYLCGKNKIPVHHFIGWMVLTMAYGFPAMEILIKITDSLLKAQAELTDAGNKSEKKSK
uniref:Uncharacterized protein n=1 Tax=Tetraselmis chuii TaxID=63592 RepID=A0A7S1X9T6_9CHLO|mmetsp:Transcript_7053/g.12798  ORF Transcript_7053/g.12798 Transcript_7053/m.12798 type:complete len:137 (+) Transcript_7053:135-545(+)